MQFATVTLTKFIVVEKILPALDYVDSANACILYVRS